MAIALALPALLLSAGIGYMNEKKRQATEQQQRSEGLIGQLITREAMAGNPELPALLDSPSMAKYIPKEALPILKQFALSQIRAQQGAQAGLRGESATPPIAELTGAGTQTAQAGGSGAGAGGVEMAPFGPPQPAQPAAAPVERTDYVTAQQPAASVPAQQSTQGAQPSSAKTPSMTDPVADLLSRKYIEPTELNPTKAKSVSTPMYGGGTKTEQAPGDDELGRRVLAAGATKGYKYTDIVEAATRKGYKITDDYKAYGEAQFNKAFQASMTGVNTSDVVATKDAARRAFQATGYLPDKFKELIVPTPEDEGALHHKTLLTALGQNKSLPEALAIANATGLRPNLQQQNDAIMKYSQNFRTSIEQHVPGLSPEQYDNLTRYATGGMGLNPEQAKGIVQPVPQSDEERAKTFRDTGKVPRMGDLPGGQGQVTGKMLEGIHRTIQGEQVSQAGAKAGAEAREKLAVEVSDRPAKATQIEEEARRRAKGEADVPRRLESHQVDEVESLKNAFASLERLNGLHSPEYVGPLIGSGTGQKAREKGNFMSRREVAHKAEVGSFVNNAVFALTGKQSNLQEAERIAGPAPKLGDQPDVFAARVSRWEEELRKKAETKKDTLGQAGFRVPEFKFGSLSPETTPESRFKQLFEALPREEQGRLNRLGNDKAKADPTMKDIYKQLRREFNVKDEATKGTK